ncbi:MAG: HD domain-containing protein [Lachnospiraceae bacterium]|nr:HD domain-containing protein [Lachnospiraceae bacterium]
MTFAEAAMQPGNLKWEAAIKRQNDLYSRNSDIRSEFARDYTRILHSLAYRRLKHKTQVFFDTKNDHVCTRVEHVAHVDSVSYTIASALGLNTELTRAIAMGHDLGHAPFGHTGEKILSELSEKYIGKKFWHEQNGVHYVDNIELLESPDRNYYNMNLTYAVRDGIISHCGEVNDTRLKPRDDAIDLYKIEKAGKVQPFTWEGCVVKLSDTIAYLGRDIEDAITLGIIELNDLRELYKISRQISQGTVNTSVIMHEFIVDIVKNSTPELGIGLSAERAAMLNEVKAFNYAKIYRNPKLQNFNDYAKLVLNSVFKEIMKYFDGAETLSGLEKVYSRKHTPKFVREFYSWVLKYCDISDMVRTADKTETVDSIGITDKANELTRYHNIKCYGDLSDKAVYTQAILDFISGMTDKYAIQCFEELISF